MSRICILDYGSGNTKSVYNLFASIISNVSISNTEHDILEATHIVLPGVGAFGASMEKIRETIPMQSLKKAIFEIKKPFLGICVGMQVLADLGYEFEENSGLGWVNGVVQKLDCGNLPVPHVGWNSIHKIKESALFERIEDGSDFYFVHSYAIKPVDTTCITSVTDYGGDFCSSLQKDNLYGVQFHPEKSHVAGKRLIENFINLK